MNRTWWLVLPLLAVLACGGKPEQNDGTWSVKTDQSNIQVTDGGSKSTWSDGQGETTVTTGDQAELPTEWPAGLQPASGKLGSVWSQTGRSHQATWTLPGTDLDSTLSTLKESLPALGFSLDQSLDMNGGQMLLYESEAWGLTVTALPAPAEGAEATLILSLQAEENSEADTP